MPTYISLLHYTQQGIANIKNAPNRFDQAKQAYAKAGGEVKGFYLTMGQYDAVVVAELPNDEAVATLALAIGSGGNVRSESFRAFTEAEMRKIIAALP